MNPLLLHASCFWFYKSLVRVHQKKEQNNDWDSFDIWYDKRFKEKEITLNDLHVILYHWHVIFSGVKDWFQTENLPTLHYVYFLFYCSNDHRLYETFYAFISFSPCLYIDYPDSWLP